MSDYGIPFESNSEYLVYYVKKYVSKNRRGLGFLKAYQLLNE